MPSRRKAIEQWASQPSISARSLLVTIFGDTLLPVIDVVWLSQLFQLTEIFGFNQRLIRTSATRLVAEGWLENERVGRVSRYHFTPLAIEESTQAADQIYCQASDDWNGDWILVFANGPKVERSLRAVLQEHLQWQGFSNLGNGVLASPTASIGSTRDLCRLLSPDYPIPLAHACFDDVEQMAASGFFRTSFAIDDQEEAYAGFVRHYSEMPGHLSELEPEEAFGLRTMIVHDFRKIRLRSAAVPPQLLPSPWIGADAFDLAAEIYAETSLRAAPFLQEILEITYPKVLKGRF